MLGAGQVQAQPAHPAALPAREMQSIHLLPADWPTRGGEQSGPVVARPAPQAAEVPLTELPAAVREQVRSVIEQPTLSATGPVDTFAGELKIYQWLLDHPDRTAYAWRNLGAPCLDIAERTPGRFGWRDGRGSDVSWQAVHVSPKLRVWYASGMVKPAALLPAMPVEAVLLMHHEEFRDIQGRPSVEHQAKFFVQTDSKTAAVLLKLLGPSVPKLSDQCLSQLGMFFSGVTTYVCRYPDRAATVLAPPPVSKTPAVRESTSTHRGGSPR